MISPLPTRAKDAGISLIESVVALSLAVVILVAVGMELVHAMHSSVLARQNSQAADLLMQQVENARNISYANLAMASGDLTGDTRITGTPPSATVGAGTGQVSERVYTNASAAITQHVTTVAIGGTTYTVSRYVTTPTACPVPVAPQVPKCVRFSAMAKWQLAGVTHRRWTSTVVAQATRGGVVNWMWSAPSGLTISGTHGTQVPLPAMLLNSGQRGQWRLTASSLPAGWTTAWYADDNGDGAWQNTETRLDTATAGTGLTGDLESGAWSRVFAVVSVPSTATGSYTVQLVATPVGITASTQTLTFTLKVT